MTDRQPPPHDRAERGPHGQPASAPVDLRILQANERTLLAWIRTGLALMAFGFVVARIGIWLRGDAAAPGGSRSGWIGVAFVVLGTVTNALSTDRFFRIRRALLEGRVVVPGTTPVLSVAFGLILLGGILIAHLLIG